MSTVCGWHLENGKGRRFLIAQCSGLAPFPLNSEKDKDHHNFYQFSLNTLKKENYQEMVVCVHDSREIS